MAHLSPDELVDLAEGTIAESDAPHLVRCDECRRELADLRATLGAVTVDAVPDPSPLFWDHLSERVRAGVRAEVVAGEKPQRAWANPRVRLLAAVAAFAAMLIVAATLRVGERRHQPAEADHSIQIVAATPDDPSLGLVAELTSDVPFDEAHDAGMMTHTGLVDRAVAGLSDTERIELEAILKEELAR